MLISHLLKLRTLGLKKIFQINKEHSFLLEGLGLGRLDLEIMKEL